MKRISKYFIIFVLLVLSVFQFSFVYSNYTAPTIYGDLNGDGYINSTDIILLKRYLLRITPSLPSPQSEHSADLDGNGRIDSTDYTLLRRYILEIMDVFPVENISPPSSVPDTGLSQDEQKIFDLANQKRIEAGLNPLVLDMNITHVARIIAQQMSDNNSLTPESPYQLIRDNNIKYTLAGFHTAGTPNVESAINRWIQTEQQVTVLFNSSFQYTGVGLVKNSRYGNVIIQIYIRK